jgi:DNA-binding response OmpR family regulator
MMPNFDGFLTCAAIRTGNLVSVLVLSSLTKRNTSDRVRRLGADVYLSKPVRLAELLRVVYDLLGTTTTTISSRSASLPHN